MRMTRVWIAAAFGLCLSSVASALAQADIRQGVSSGDVVLLLRDLQQANAELRAQITGLESQNATLNGKVETLQFLLTQSRDQINDMQVDDAEIDRLMSDLRASQATQLEQMADLNRRLSAVSLRVDEMNALETGPAFGEGLDLQRLVPAEAVVEAGAAGPQPAESPDAGVPAADPEPLAQMDAPMTGGLGTLPASDLPGEAGPLFAEAKSRLLQFDYAGAEGAFRQFLDLFGDDPQAGEAQYWLGEALYQQEAYAASGQAYTRMIREYPDDPRAPEALAKLARSMRLVGDTERACSALDVLPQRYPEASGVTRNLAAGERARSGCES